MPLWFRWARRDLRARWVQVSAIALIIALGSGLYSGLSSGSEWRRVSYDESFGRLHMYDLHATLADGSYVDAAQLVEAAQSIPSAERVAAVEPRLIVPTQIDASRGDQVILVPGELVGVDVADGGPHVSGIFPEEGREFAAADADQDVAILDAHFADNFDLPATGTVEVSGGTTLEYVGHGLSPEYYLITGDVGLFLAEGSYAVAFVPLETVQRIAGQPGNANDLVLTLEPGTDVDVVERELRAVLDERFPEVGATVNQKAADDSYRYLYDDIEGDQRLYNIFAVLILLGAAFAAFNLTGRMVEAQRREIGVGMALGASPRRLAVRPLLVALGIALLGVVFGLAVGVIVSDVIAGVTESFFPLPYWRHPFQPGVFARGAALGIAIPFLAALYPVWRALRVTPVEAIRTGFLATKSSGLAGFLRRIPIPGRSTAQMPFRDTLRAPRRTLMTVLGVGAAITVLVGLVGMIDSFLKTIDEVESELTSSSPERVDVRLDFFYPVDAEQVQAIEASPLAGAAEPVLELGGTLLRGDTEIDTLLEVRDFDSTLWAPTVDDRREVDGPGLVLTETAADDLGVDVGDTVTLRHPRRQGVASYEFVESEVTVVGTSPFPVRSVTFLDDSDADLFDLAGITNMVMLDPAPGTTVDEVKQGLFGTPAVASVEPVSAFTESFREEIQSFVGVLYVIEAGLLLLALLIAFNSASINTDERAREHATMFAFGLRLRSVMRMAIVESFLIGVGATLAGLAAGWVLLDFLVNQLLPETVPDIGIVTYLAPSTVAVAVLLGVVAVALAPLLTTRKLRRMDLPSTLRVVE